jgi:hypothetical protein
MEIGTPDEHPSKSAIAKTDTQLLRFIYAPEHSLAFLSISHRAFQCIDKNHQTIAQNIAVARRKLRL